MFLVYKIDPRCLCRSRGSRCVRVTDHHAQQATAVLMWGKRRNRKERTSYLSATALTWVFAAAIASLLVVVGTGSASSSSAALARRGQQCSGFLGVSALQQLNQQVQHHQQHHQQLHQQQQREQEMGSRIRSTSSALVHPHSYLRFLSPWATRGRSAAAAAAQCEGWGGRNKRSLVLEPAAGAGAGTGADVGPAGAADPRLLLRSRRGVSSLAIMTTGGGGVFQETAAAATAYSSSSSRPGGGKVLPTAALRGGGDGRGDGISRRMKSVIDTRLRRSSSTVAAAAAATATATAEADAAVEIIKPDRDVRSYRYLVLPNGLAVVLVSDPYTERAAASMFIRAGHMQDPSELAGMAHFHEHSERLN